MNNNMQNEGLYTEAEGAGYQYRENQLNELIAYIDKGQKSAAETRNAFFTPDFSSVHAYCESIKPYREKFINMLGNPLSDYKGGHKPPVARQEFVAKDELGRIFRLTISALAGLSVYGLLFLPDGCSKFPLVIALHGGLGTPELAAGFTGQSNYNDMVRRVQRKGFAVFAPQLLLWSDERGPVFDREVIDRELKELGGSITSIEVLKLIRAIDYFSARDDIDETRIGMIGLSYGGFYTLFTAACDTRIRTVLSSCYFNERFKYSSHDRSWFNAGNQFLDAEICKLICPRPLYIEVALRDELFDVRYAREEIKRVTPVYKRLGVPELLIYQEFDGVHELNPDNDGIDFLCSNL